MERRREKYNAASVPEGHPLAGNGTRGPGKWATTEHRLVLFNKIGPGTHPCHWCGRAVTWGRGRERGTLLADHVNGLTQDNRPENIVPSCSGCNSHRNRRIPDDELFVVGNNGKRHRAVRRNCGTCGTEFIIRLASVKRGEGTYCSRSCMYARNRHR